MLLRIDSALQVGTILLEEPDDCTSLKITASASSRESARWTFDRSRIGVMMQDGTALVEPEALRRLAGNRVGPGWNDRFEAMLAMARDSGWASPDGRIFVHTEWDTTLEDGLPIVAPESFKKVLGQFPTGIAIIAAAGTDSPVGFACQSFLSLSLDPPLIALAPARSSTSWPKIAEVGAFCVNVLSEDQIDVCRQFAISGGDKFAGLEWTPSQQTGSPIIDGCLAWVDCRLELTHDAGDHELVLGRVVELDVREGRPLVFYGSKFAQLAAS
jgi:3-hydroxy-9,10-secoandrosta-1,3,5(10)-triene-9,17-dione monooxygenase reductase component